MFRNSHEIDVDQLMHDIRQSVAQQRRELAFQTDDLSLAPTETPAIPQNGYPPLTLQPEFRIHPDGEYHVRDFLKYHGVVFVRNAYKGLLNREPDREGEDLYVAELANGKLNKLDVLARLHYSEEGKNAGVKVAGLSGPAFIRKLERLPIVGYVVGLAIAVSRLPALHQYMRQSEFHLLTQQEQLANHFERAHGEVVQSFQRTATTMARITSSLASHQRAIDQQLAELREYISDLRENAERGMASLSAALERLESRSTALGEQTAALRNEIEAQFKTLADQQEEIRTDLSAEAQYYASLRQELQHQLPRLSLSSRDPAEDDRSLNELYAAFEDQFRGAREEIKTRLEVYLPVLREAGITSGFLDVGCGRGEWLELLREAGMQGYGIDHNSVLIERCRQLGLTVVLADALTHLQGLSDGSLGFVTGFHIVEHISFFDLIKLLDEVSRTLKPGGGAIFETPNPENFMVGSNTFYTDPTHRNPIPSATLKFLLESRGFTNVTVMKLREWDDAKLDGDSELVKRFNEYFYAAPDYAVVGWKP